VHSSRQTSNNQIVIFTLALIAATPFSFNVQSGSGLSVTINGVPVIQGSWFQYYESGWTKGYYSSQYNAQKIIKIDEDTVQLTYRSDDGRATGQFTYHRSGNDLLVKSHFEWAGTSPAKVEACPGMVWLPAVSAGTLSAASASPVSLNSIPAKNAPEEARHPVPAANELRFLAPLADIGLTSSHPIASIDGRNYDQDWSQGKSLLWLGNSDLDVSSGHPADFTVTWHFEPHAPATAIPTITKLNLMATANPAVEQPDESRPILIPQPKTNRLNWDKTLVLTGNYAFPAGRFRYFPAFLAALNRRFILPSPKKTDEAVAADGGVSKLGFAPGGYRITITPTSITTLGEEEEGLQNAIARLAQLAFIKNGKVCLPTGTLIDQPETKFRGIHLFVGPDARKFHRQLWSRVLRPLGLNSVVLQCERTAWNALPGTATPITMTREALKDLFDDYRADNVEPIPLIQSLGHMEWFFANNQNRNLALNPDIPYTLDSRKPEAQAKIAEVWDEACALLQPKSIHFGLDEIDMRGFASEDNALTTELWIKQLPFLGKIARQHNAQMMLWGDQALAPGEAPDAALGDTPADARMRRAAIPKGAIITDWHYKADNRFQIFRPNLQLWKDAGFGTIAATWYRPENIRGFDVAANMTSSGILQTTWAGYASSEDALFEHPEQFTSMVLTADYAWSGRQDLPDQIGYDPVAIFRKMYFDPPKTISARSGWQFTDGTEQSKFSVSGVEFAGIKPITLATPLQANLPRPSSVTIPIGHKATSIALALDTETTADTRAVVGEVTVNYANGKSTVRSIRYGLDIRAEGDPASTLVTDRSAGISIVRIEGASSIQSITLSNRGSYAGLRLRGLVAF
jgi:hexosaminidase